MSPGTSSLAFSVATSPSRIARAEGADMLLSASSAFSARPSCSAPSAAFSTTIRRMSNGSMNPCPSKIATASDTAAAAIRIRIITSRNCEKKRDQNVLGGLPLSAFSPKRLRRSSASALVSPRCASTPNCMRTLEISVACGDSGIRSIVVTLPFLSPGDLARRYLEYHNFKVRITKSFPNVGNRRPIGCTGKKEGITKANFPERMRTCASGTRAWRWACRGRN